MVGIVIVSHSAKLANGIVELAKEMAGNEVKIEAAGGMALEGHPLGTDSGYISQAIEKVYSEDGVLVLMDLGSALLSTEMAVEMLPSDKQNKIFLCPGPLVEGAVTAAVQARLGNQPQEICSEVMTSLKPKIEHLNAETTPAKAIEPEIDASTDSIKITIKNPMGLHARPAAHFVETVGLFDAKVLVKNISQDKGPVNAKSINMVATLGVRKGETIQISASGPESKKALEALNQLAEENFGEEPENILLKRNRSQPINKKASTTNKSEIAGIPASSGIAIGSARHFSAVNIKIPTNQTTEPEKEWDKLSKAIEKTQKSIQDAIQKPEIKNNQPTSEIFKAHLLFLTDEALLLPAKQLIFEDKYNAIHAWQHTIDFMTQKYQSAGSEFIQNRAIDIMDIGQQVILNFLEEKNTLPTILSPGILIARNLTPSDTARLEPSFVKAICTAEGSPTSHSAILAKSLGIPCIVGLGEAILNIKENITLIVDAEKGIVIQNPDNAIKKSYQNKIKELVKERTKDEALATKTAITLDGKKIPVNANIGSSTDVLRASQEGADGIGLFRTEFLFLDRQSAPTEEEQFNIYCEVAKAMNGNPVTIRTLDIGGDKPIPFLNLPKEKNPFLGTRGIRISLSRQHLFKDQLRAIAHAASLYPIKVMFPMIATIDEFGKAKELLFKAQVEVCNKQRIKKTDISTGIMIEVPSAAICAEKFAQEVDFFSIGTNDLIQYIMAAERGNSALASLTSPLYPAVLKIIYQVVTAAHKFGKKVSVCGEAGGDINVIPFLLGLGVDELSINISGIPTIKSFIRKLDYTILNKLSAKAVNATSILEVQKLISSFLSEIGVMA